jgi:hypothetical protein
MPVMLDQLANVIHIHFRYGSTRRGDLSERLQAEGGEAVATSGWYAPYAAVCRAVSPVWTLMARLKSQQWKT